LEHHLDDEGVFGLSWHPPPDLVSRGVLSFWPYGSVTTECSLAFGPPLSWMSFFGCPPLHLAQAWTPVLLFPGPLSLSLPVGVVAYFFFFGQRQGILFFSLCLREIPCPPGQTSSAPPSPTNFSPPFHGFNVVHFPPSPDSRPPHAQPPLFSGKECFFSCKLR